MTRLRSVEEFADRNERARIARLRADAKLTPVERLDEALRLSRFLAELADAGRQAPDVRS